jgi:hypothetical protein
MSTECTEITSVVICRKCKRAFIPGKGLTMSGTLPCGHVLSAWFTASLICDYEPGRGRDDHQDDEEAA